MLFNHNDLMLLNDQIEYIDTAIIPAIPADYASRLLDIADQYEMIQYVTLGAEQQFKGRLLVLPPVQILGDYNAVSLIDSQLKEFGFRNIIVVCPQTLQIDADNVHKVNIIPLESMDNEMKQEFIQDNVKSLMKFIIKLWNK
ncbi:DUF2487 family protein [Macrococcoides canis]|uniref:DUF2487 family protein n=1 Tax=Macrococcoides canis TaxID=1855823 RepID=A0A4V3BGB5_9STAP|nr:DUF2487 family protein [Macrococcus canis]MEE1108103.1 DUF2487 family protein [Macrococcus canis]TDM18305.1 DUF2487 family protein [Macrococcus canis]TDM21650.1 DUF2487 family protein [Macrococcus canis]TDM23464.1 DUF2487 family protein [Macrococcus canis]TDM31790.1 DUF2487 family protein [Macrococcus canis]